MSGFGPSGLTLTCGGARCFPMNGIAMRRWSRRGALVLALAPLLLAPLARAADASCAVVVLHGKWGTPQGLSVCMKASVLLSYFDPQGWGDMPTTIARLKPGVPLLMVAGTGDPGYPHDRAMFDLAPRHPASRFVTVQSDHFGTPDAATAAVLEWLRTVATD